MNLFTEQIRTWDDWGGEFYCPDGVVIFKLEAFYNE
jgi:hypothetical protein